MDAIANDGTKCVEELKQLIAEKGRHIHQDCMYLWSKYEFLSAAITKMESTKLTLQESVGIFQDVVERVAAVNCAKVI